METSVRVVVANRPRLLRELVLSTLSGQEGISCGRNGKRTGRAFAGGGDEARFSADRTGRAAKAAGAVLLQEFPALRIIAVAPNKNLGIFYWASFDIHSRTMEAGEEALLEAMRNSVVPAKGGMS
ncbi:MAG TPA: hypothetical protein VIW93_11195 [Candidatus Acidoferrum sp.]